MKHMTGVRSQERAWETLARLRWTSLVCALSVMLPPVYVYADQLMTLECKGKEEHIIQKNKQSSSSSSVVTRSYTLKLALDHDGAETGMWFDWEAKNWFNISSVSPNTYELLNEDDSHLLLSITRNSGKWVEHTFRQGSGSNFDSFTTIGSCKKTALKMPNRL